MTVVSWRGVRMDQSTKDKLLLAEAWIQHDLKDPSFTLSFPQGSYSNGSLSAGTHSGGGVVDVHCVGYPTATKVVMMKYLRACLGFGWHRPYNWDGAGGGEHMHIGELGNPNMSSALAAQVVQWNNHTNGLASHGPDNDSIDVAAGRPARITSPPVVAAPPPPPPPPVTPPPPVASPPLEVPVVIVAVDRSSVPKGTAWPGDFLLLGDGTIKHIKTVAALNAYTKLGVATKTLSYADYQALLGGLG